MPERSLRVRDDRQDIDELVAHLTAQELRLRGGVLDRGDVKLPVR